MLSAMHSVFALDSSETKSEPRISASPKGLSALVHCLRKYVASNSSRFEVVETTKERYRVQTIIRSEKMG